MKWRFSENPAVWISVITAGLTLAASFGLHLTPERTGALAAFLTVLGGAVTRSQVTPV